MVNKMTSGCGPTAIAPNRNRCSPPLGDLRQRPRHAPTRPRSVHFQRQAFSRIAIDHSEDSQPPSTGCHIAKSAASSISVNAGRFRM